VEKKQNRQKNNTRDGASKVQSSTCTQAPNFLKPSLSSVGVLELLLRKKKFFSRMHPFILKSIFEVFLGKKKDRNFCWGPRLRSKNCLKKIFFFGAKTLNLKVFFCKVSGL